MKGRWVWIVISANLLALVALVFVYPHLMVSPGALVPEHAALATDCFACHAPLRGASAERCIACHALPDIGLRTTLGVAITGATATPLKRSFHQELIDPNCMACHSDHAGPKFTQHSRKPFSHAMLRPQARERCDACHTPPDNNMHRSLTEGCAQCHATEAWKPATFEHDKYFLLDRHHNVACATCHVAGDHSKYTCYGCHEHTPAKVRAEHEEEGIQDFEDCVECHRSADGEAEGEGRREGGQKGGAERD